VWEGAEKNGARLVVKAHPNESKPLLERMLAEEGVKAAKVAQNESLRALLLASDAVCMNFSQAGMEAVITDTPLVVVQSKEQLQGFEDWVPYVREGAAIFADENEPMAAKIAPLLSDEKARAERLAAAARFRNKFIMPDGIVPKDRIVAEILKAL
jgi:CDP-glycerol glycerophosphotransferase (TagB/SpsB family)